MSSVDTASLEFGHLTPYKPRKFVPKETDFTDLGMVTGLYEKLLSRELGNPQEFEQWILDRSELEAALYQAGSILYIRMTCQTDDKSRASAYSQFIKTITPAVKPLEDQLNKRFLNEKDNFNLDQKRYEVYTREITAEVDLFIEENVDLQTKVDLLSQEYQVIFGVMTVHFQGKEHTLPEMTKYLYDQDRALREKAWNASSQRRLEDREKLDDLFDEMLKIRHQMACNAGCKNYVDYKFRELHRFDYSPDDCKQYHKTVEKRVVPLWSAICERRKRQMKLDNLRPWDSAVDPLGRPPLKPFNEVSDLINKCEKIFGLIDPEFGSQFKGMAQEGLLDLASKKGKAPGGYQNSLDESRKPFIFMNAVGIDSDVNTLFHEGGHAFHSLACSDEELVDYRHGPMEFNEVASMAMELLAGEYLEEFYSEEDKTRSKEGHLEDIIFTLAWVATIDCFQHWIYENPEHTRQERRDQWINIRRRFGGNVYDWSDLDEQEAYLWHRQLHIFEVPFYYIEYGIAQLGALQVWLNAKENWKKAIQDYKNGLALGGAVPLPEIFRTAGIQFNFSDEIIAPLMKEIGKEISLDKNI